MIEAYRNNPDVSLVTSAKNLIDADGNITGSTQNFAAQNLKLTGDEAARLLFSIDNYIGEPTTVLIRKKFLRDNDLCWNEDEPGFFSLVDVSTWLQLLTKGNLFRCVEPLSALRVHSEQGTFWKFTGALFAINYVKLFKTSLDRKVFFHTEEQIRTAMFFLFRYCLNQLQRAQAEKYHSAEIETLEKTFANLAQALTNNHKIELPKIEYSDHGLNSMT